MRGKAKREPARCIRRLVNANQALGIRVDYRRYLANMIKSKKDGTDRQTDGRTQTVSNDVFGTY